MNASQPATRLRVSDFGSDGGVLYADEDAAPAEKRLLAMLEELPSGGVLEVDLSGVKLASDASRRLLRRALLRLSRGELDDRALVIVGLEYGTYNLRVMLESEGLTAVERPVDGSAPRLIGKVDSAVRETYDYICSRTRTTAQDVLKHFELLTIAAATNRLTRLKQLGLARRVEQEPVEGGGRQYVYVAVA